MAARPGFTDPRVACVLAVGLLAATVYGCGDNMHGSGAGCAQSADCQQDQLCDWPPQYACGHDHMQGTCVPYERRFCPQLGFWVCGCDGATYTNECQTHSRGLSIDYGGPCRPAGTYVACSTSSDCPVDPEFAQYCVDDPRAACVPSSNSTCPGICVHANYVCSETLACLSATSSSEIDSPETEACIAVKGCTDPSCAPGRCVYTTRVACTSSMDCGSGELCLAELDCDPRARACPGVCVRP